MYMWMCVRYMHMCEFEVCGHVCKSYATVYVHKDICKVCAQVYECMRCKHMGGCTCLCAGAEVGGGC